MNYISTKGQAAPTSLRDAVLSNIPSDGGLFIPAHLPKLSEADREKIREFDFARTAHLVLSRILGAEIPDSDLLEICKRAFTFTAPLLELSENEAVLELFHGPTLAFKDVGVRFMAELLAYFAPGETRTVLTATSGDTGAAVASAFYKRPNTRVFILYPKGKISPAQEAQIACLGDNISAIAVHGAFDECQQMVKAAFTDRDLSLKLGLSSANSINLARLLPQVAYYASGWAQAAEQTSKRIIFSVPSGNFGNVTAGLIAQRIGIPIERIIAATNSNDVVPRYFESNNYEERVVRETLTTAMDIAAPNNFPRIESLFGPGAKSLRATFDSIRVSDAETLRGMSALYERYRYVSDPHGALAYFGGVQCLKSLQEAYLVFLETAHPVKFADTVRGAIGFNPQLPPQLADLFRTPVKSIEMEANPQALLRYLIN